jgi:hypothetical protein
MKKILSLTLIALLLFSLFSCNKEEAKSSDVIGCEFPDTFSDENEFLQYIVEAQKTLTDDNISVNATSNNLTIPIPKLIKEGYAFSYGFESNNDWNFLFPTDEYSPEEPTFSGYIISVCKNLNTFDIVADQFGVTAIDNYANHKTPNTNMMIINMENRLVYIQSRGSAPVIDTPEKLSEYFVFEDYIIENDNSNVVTE